MKTNIIDGKALANNIVARVTEQVTEFNANKVKPTLAAIIVGDNPASQVYVKHKLTRCAEAGIQSKKLQLPASIDTHSLLENIRQLNQDTDINGILLQLPLPQSIDDKMLLSAITPEKDVDGFHPVNVGNLVIGKEGLIPCTPFGVLMMIKSIDKNLSGKHAVIIGRSTIVGKPMVQLMLQNNCTVTTVHSNTPNPKELCSQADILIVAVGRKHLVNKDWVKPGAIVIDVGINAVNDEHQKRKLVGDVDFDDLIGHASAVSPVPGGVGPMTVACLLVNTLICTAQQRTLSLEKLQPHLFYPNNN